MFESIAFFLSLVYTIEQKKTEIFMFVLVFGRGVI